MTAPTSNQGANAPIIAVLGVDRNIAITVTENGVARPWASDVITALIYEKDGITPAAVTTWTFTTGADAAATQSLTEAQLATLGAGSFKYAVVNDTQDQPWYGGDFTIVTPSRAGTATTGLTLALTTGGGITLELSVVATAAAQVSVLDPNSYWLVDTLQGVADQVGSDFARRSATHGGIPTAAAAQSTARNSSLSSNSILSSGRESVVLVWLNAGQVVTSITFMSGTQALVAGTNQWFSLRTSARVLLKTTADDTNTAWTSNTLKTLTLSGGTYTVLTSGFYYVGIMVAAGTPPSLISSNSANGSAVGIVPILTGNDATNTGLTTPATAPATSAAYTISGNLPYAYVS
jgi:hypothetical protein